MMYRTASNGRRHNNPTFYYTQFDDLSKKGGNMFGQITELLTNILSELKQLNEREISWMKEVRDKDKLTELRQDREWAYIQMQWKKQEEREEAEIGRAHV